VNLLGPTLKFVPIESEGMTFAAKERNTVPSVVLKSKVSSEGEAFPLNPVDLRNTPPIPNAPVFWVG
jgi:hypothetical protein